MCIVLNVHHSPRVSALCAAAGVRLLFLPLYSPDLNPIERMFSKLKTALRRAAARTREALLNAFGNALAGVTPDDIHPRRPPPLVPIRHSYQTLTPV